MGIVFALLAILLMLVPRLVAQQSPTALDWQFPISTWSNVDYQNAYLAALDNCKTSKAVRRPFNCQYYADHKGWHLGLDIVADKFTEVRAAATGKVRYADRYGWVVGCNEGDTNSGHGGWGYLIVVESTLSSGEVIQTIYGHLDWPLIVSEGQVVEKDAIIARVGHYEAPNWVDHLHFGVYKGSFIRIDNDNGCNQRFPKFHPAGYFLGQVQYSGDQYLEPTQFILARVTSTPIPPVIHYVGPNPANGSLLPQLITIQGTGFNSQSAVILQSFPDSGSGQTLSNLQISVQDSGHLVVNPVLGINAARWTAVVTSGGQSSAPYSFQVNGVAVSPIIQKVFPSPVTGSTGSQQFFIQGSGFSSQSTVTFRSKPVGGDGQTYAKQPIVSLSPTQIELSPTFGTTSSLWTAEVLNGPVSSGEFSFQVNSPNIPGPAIREVQPNPIFTSSFAQLFTIVGSNFDSSSTVTFRSKPPTGGGQTYPNQMISSRSSGQLTLNPNFGTVSSPWSVEVLNRNVSSGEFNFAVYGLPTITSFSWSSQPHADVPFDGIITGSGFAGTIQLWFCIQSTSTCFQHPSAGVNIDNSNRLAISQVRLGSGSWTFYVQTNSGKSSFSNPFLVR